MQPHAGLERFQVFFKTLQSKYALNRFFILLTLFLLAVILISFVIPLLSFGRFFGTDDYAHLFHTKIMASSLGLDDFYNRVGGLVSNPYEGDNSFNYPFGLWLFAGTLAKITGLPVLTASFLFVIFFLLIIIGSFYVYSGIFLDSKEQKILAVLFLLSMPNVIIYILSFRPSVFILPFLFILMYITLKEPFQWKLLPIIWLMIFLIIISHTGSFIFLITFTVLFFLLYCLLWGRISLPTYLVILSILVIYIYSLTWFPGMGFQYEDKSTLFLAPGEFFVKNFNVFLPLNLGTVFYEKVIIDHELIYTIILGASIYALGKLFQNIHRTVSARFQGSEQLHPLTLPISNISHSVASTPIWLGPMHVILSCFGFFRLDNRGKCIFISILLVTILPDIFFEGPSATGVLREISYAILIIPITAALGFWMVLSYLDVLNHPRKNLFSLSVWVIVLLAVIITPAIATTYYLPKISNDDYIVDGMQWLGNTGDPSETVVGYGYRTVPIYTNMTDATYKVQSGYEARTFLNYLRGAFFSSGEGDVTNLQHYFGVNYILVSEKIAANLGSSNKTVIIDNNTALDKIYSCRDFGIFAVTRLSEVPTERRVVGENISIEQTSSSIQIKTQVYKVVLNTNYPVIEQFGSPTDNYLGDGFIVDTIRISGLRQPDFINPFSPLDESQGQDLTDGFSMDKESFTFAIKDNQVIYRTILSDQKTGENESSLLVRYTFFPETIKKEYLVSNNWVTSPFSTSMEVTFSTNLFVPLNEFTLKSNQTTLKRHIYQSQDNVRINENIEELYVHEGGRGIYIKNELSAPYPASLFYKGSTLYNMSSVGMSQSESLKPGATLHTTQFLSPGDEITARKHIETRDNIRLIDYPDGMIPILLSGYRTAFSDNRSEGFITDAYQILQDNDIPYSEMVISDLSTEIPAITNETESTNTSSASSQNIRIDLGKLRDINIKIIGSKRVKGLEYFDNYTIQEQTISSLIEYANQDAVHLIGFMPASMIYNLDTLKIISEKNIPILFSNPVYPPYLGIIGTETRSPQMAMYQDEESDVVLLPISYPMSTSLSPETNKYQTFSAWKATIDEAAVTDSMVLFIIQSADIGNPFYTDDMKGLISYAKAKGLTFTTPDAIAEHYKKLQKIQYSGSVQNDRAIINLTNNNDENVQYVTFRVLLPILQTGGYQVSEGRIVRTIAGNDYVIIYVSTDIPSRGTKEITIEPEAPRKTMVVNLPMQPIEGPVQIFIKDTTGKPLVSAEAIIDSKYYYPNQNGVITIDLKRGIHSLEIHNPGYENYSSIFRVKGRIYLLNQFFNKQILT